MADRIALLANLRERCLWGGDTRKFHTQFGVAMTGDKLSSVFEDMNRKRRYRKLLLMVEACFSGGVTKQCEGIPGMLFVTAANGDETSKADVFNSEMKVWMSNRFTSTRCV